MRLGKVVGTVVATQKADALKGGKLLIVREMTVDGSLTHNFVVAIDGVGAGVGEVVLTVAGSSARMTETTRDSPVDTAIVGIVDSVELGGKTVFRKSGD
ncbi:MAG: EutN/CcmL family microcompartment protein [Armatimonadota bacterium]